MKPRTVGICLIALFAPDLAGAVTMVGFDHARPQKPQTLEVGGALGLGDHIITLQGHGRMGLLDEIDATLRAAIVDFDAPGDDETGFEVELEGRMRFLRAADTKVVDVAFAGAASILKTEDVFALGLDPQVIASRHIEIAAGREMYVAASLGLAITHADLDGRSSGSDTDGGLLGAVSVGVDVVRGVRLAAELRLRDEFERVGLGVSHTF